MPSTAARPRLEVADILRAHGEAYAREHGTSRAQRAVLRHLVHCRTAALGGHVDACDRCGRVRVSYNSCRDRHCPKCQSLKRADWLEARRRQLLPVPYWHLVFTLPDRLNPLILRNKKVVFRILFDTAADTLLTLGRDPKHLGAQVGFTAILHTWGQNLLFHPHLHCVVTGGGLDPGGQRWVSARTSFFLPVKVLGRLFRGKFLDALAAAHRDGELDLRGSTARLASPQAWRRMLDELYRTDWVVYAKLPFGGPEHVFRYLGRYTHRIAISNHRLISLEGGQVRFQIRDHADDGRRKTLDVSAGEFIRRFLLHVLPRRFVRIRHYGLLAARNIHTRLAAARHLLDRNAASIPRHSAAAPHRREPWWSRLLRYTGIDVMACPYCEGGRLIRRQELTPAAAAGRAPP
ncbi:MAG: IS91 family transposase [Planctomycetota bacterium]|jgi:hypothetical protein